MREERITAKRMVVRQLKKAERALDQAGIEIARLCITTIEARQTAGLSATVGSAELSRMTRLFSEWSVVREQAVGTHHDLYELDGQLGLRPYASGDLDEKPQALPAAPEGNIVRITSAAA